MNHPYLVVVCHHCQAVYARCVKSSLSVCQGQAATYAGTTGALGAGDRHVEICEKLKLQIRYLVLRKTYVSKDKIPSVDCIMFFGWHKLPVWYLTSSSSDQVARYCIHESH